MSEFILSESSTFFTQHNDKIVREETSGGSALFREKYSYKLLTNINQLDHIIHHLVVKKNFMMDSCSKEKVVFSHNQNDFHHNTEYVYWPSTMEFEKIEKSFLSLI